MALTITNDTKNAVSVTNVNKDEGTTWDLATFTWDQAEGTWDVPGLVTTEETKNSVTITNVTKNA